MNKLRDIPTSALLEMWTAERERLSHLERVTPEDCRELLEMRSELDRRVDYPKPSAYADFAKEYLTD